MDLFLLFSFSVEGSDLLTSWDFLPELIAPWREGSRQLFIETRPIRETEAKTNNETKTKTCLKFYLVLFLRPLNGFGGSWNFFGGWTKS